MRNQTASAALYISTTFDGHLLERIDRHRPSGVPMLARLLSLSATDGVLMTWNTEPIPYDVALQIGWNLPADVVGAGVYGGIVKRDGSGRVVIGDEWPENNRAPPAHNPVHSRGPYLDFSQLTPENRGYSKIATAIMSGQASELEALLRNVSSDDERRKLANLVMTGGARPLHMCGMSRGGDSSELIQVLIAAGGDPNAKDNYEMTPVDRLASNAVRGNRLLRKHGAVSGRQLTKGVPTWDADEFAYSGPGES